MAEGFSYSLISGSVTLTMHWRKYATEQQYSGDELMVFAFWLRY